MKCFIHANLFDFQHYLEDAYILFNETIIEVGKMSTLPKGDYEIFDLQGKTVMPGLVCGHTHLYSYFARGLSLPFSPKNFQEILDQLWWKIDGALDLENVYSSGVGFATEFAQNGVTTIIDHHASGAISGSLEELRKAVIDRVGLRGVFCFESSDRFDLQECIEENNQFANKTQKGTSAALFGMHASMSLREQSLQQIAASATMPLHLHVAESLMDESLSLKKYGKPIIHRLQDLGLLRKGSLFVHGVHLLDEEMDLIQQHHINMVVCVTSNMNNGVGLPDIARMQEKGIRVLIGNDGLSSAMAGEYLNVVYSQHLRHGTPSAFSLDNLRQMILDTYDFTSQTLGVPLGQIKEGYASDLIVLDDILPKGLTMDQAFGHLFYGVFSSFKPRHVHVRNEFLVFDYQLQPSLKSAMESVDASRKRFHAKFQGGEERS